MPASALDPHREDHQAALLAALAWQHDFGADVAVTDQPANWYQFQPKHLNIAPPAATPVPSAPQKQPESQPTPEESQAQHLAKACPDLKALEAALQSFAHPLREQAQNTVFGDGNPAARIMVIGEAPGGDEDRLGKPFVGRSGQLLDQILAAIGLNRHAEHPQEAFYVTNIIPWRPMGNRAPSIEETHIFKPFIDRHIALVNPDILLFFGGVAAKTMLQTQTGIMRLRGKWTVYKHPEQDLQIAAMPSLHPAYLLRSPLDKRLVWRDMLSVQEKLADLPNKTSVNPEE